MKKLKKDQKKRIPKLPRIHRVTFAFNEEEHKAVCSYIKKYKITNKSRLYREVIMKHVIKTLVNDYPTLFKENEMR
jgi:hypothetical protein